MSTKDLMKKTEQKMSKVIEAYRHELSTVRTGRANPGILDGIFVDYYGTPTPLNQVGNISAPESRLLVIQPWDKSVIGAVEKAIQTSNLGLNPSNDGEVIRIPIPQLTEERRKELVKLVRKKSEDFKVEIRNIRRSANDDLKKLEKDDSLSEDTVKATVDDIQELTNTFIGTIDEMTKHKEEAVMEI